MNRLTHTDKGFFRSLQMSKIQFFVFVEGGLDRPFTERLINRVFPKKSWGHAIVSMKEFPSATGGKPALLKLFKILRKQKQLQSIAFGKKMSCLFFADKDIDDILKDRVRSPHFIYTRSYDLEGHLFTFGNLTEAISDACLITNQQASNFIGDPDAWIRHQVINWKEWIALCIISKIHNLSLGCGYTRPSDINPDYTSPTNHESLNDYSHRIQTTLGMSAENFSQLHSKFSTIVENSANLDNPLRYFKGKWLQLLLEKSLEQAARVPDSNINGAGERILSTLVAQVGTKNSCKCCNPFIKNIQNISAFFEQ